MRLYVLHGIGLHVFIPLIFTFCISSGFVLLIGGKLNMRINYQKSRLWLCLPVILTCLMDVAVTLSGQPAAYWISSYRVVNEANPVSYWFLTIHPLAFILYNIYELFVVSLLIIALPEIVSKLISVFYTIGSAKAVYYWMVGTLHQGFWVSNLLLIIPAIVLVYAFEKASGHKSSQ
jgi:hypothetical protein